ncbi:hypothetical protein ASG43_00725 [Aureimonas sp. Leaf454]|uniref:hypothetical protein n=1 Tax=Aureimonas sp. Leaf454 TaxID=1736381 RepID=UPI0006F6AC4A|nr:hypothetical protein [Aureimonas sp. Leaf454]KQT54189.1 hypothetical protein ASG43_00725 [Aureimonas sp. Leaf454]
MNQSVVKFRSKSEREQDVNLLAQYGEIGIAAIAAANQAFRGKQKQQQQGDAPRRTAVVGYSD